MDANVNHFITEKTFRMSFYTLWIMRIRGKSSHFYAFVVHKILLNKVFPYCVVKNEQKITSSDAQSYL